MPYFSIIVDNSGGQNKNNLTVPFLNKIKQGGFFGTSTFHLYLKEP